MIFEIIKCLFLGICTGIDMFLRFIPFYEQLSNMKAQLIASVIGIPLIVVILITFIIKICSNFIKNN